MINIIEKLKEFGKLDIVLWDYCDWNDNNDKQVKIIKSWIKKALKENTEAVCKSMLVEEREIDKSNPEAEIGIKKAIFYANDKGFNQSCALQKELAEKLVPIDNNKSTKSRVSI